MPPKNPTKRYQKKDPISHCLDRPDMYVGSTRLRNVYEYVADSKDNGEYYIYNKEINSSPAILRIFIEALSNAIDNVERSKQTDTPCTTIKVSIDKDTGLTSIWNDGDVIPIEMDPDENVYNHTMIFGQLLTGSNYDDEEERIVAGRNGLGIKLCSIFSTSFTVEGVDPKQQKIFTQSWTNNMRDIGEPIVKNKKGKGYTKVSWTPDITHFGMDNYTDDIIQLYTRHVIDAAMISKVKVYLNDNLIPIKNLQQYSQLYDTPTTEKLYIKTDSAEVLITPSSSFQVISFVNGVYTRLGGQHVDAWSEEIFRPIVDKFNGKDKKTKTKTPKINITDVKQFFRLFIVSTVVRPEFDGQDKNKLEAPQVVAQVKSTHINAITKWSVMDNIEDIIRSKEMLVLKKAEKGKKKNVKVEGLDPANNAGGKYSSDCSLFVCEGLSAKTYVVAGIDTGVYGKKGRDWFGVLPVTGKLLNVRNATPTSIADNKVIVSFIQTTGLRHGVDYTIEENFKTLSYGKVIVVADADCFTKDTPLLIKIDGKIDIITCENLYKNYNSDFIEIWSHKGWTKIKAIKKKETNKKVLQITSGCGLLRCTEDHKMILENGEEVLANQIKIGDCLLRTRRIQKPDVNNSSNYYNIMTKYQVYKKTEKKNIKDMMEAINFEGYFCNDMNLVENNYITEEEAFVWGMFFSEGTCDIYTFSKNRNTQTEKNTERSRKRWMIWINKYKERIDTLSIKESLSKNGKKLLSDTKKRLKNAEKMVFRSSTEKKSELYRTNYSWNISNCDKNLLEKCYNIMVKLYPKYNWSIIECTKRDEKYKTPYKLILNGGKSTEDFIKKFRERFYDSENRSHKKVPVEILNSSVNIQQSFLNGYYEGDGFRYLQKTKNATGFDILGQIGAQGMCFILERLGYCVNIHNKKADIFTIDYSNTFRRLYPGQIKDIKNIEYNDYVYDIETENHQLNAGIGGLVVHNCDGIHIEGLIMNLIHSLFPSLLDRKEPYLIGMKTPIARVFIPKKDDLLFYDENRFNKYISEQTKKVNAKYYKGLGTTREEDVPDTFGLKMIEYITDNNSNTNMNKVFHKKYADARKTWLEEYSPHEQSFSLDDQDNISQMSISNFLNGEMIKFSHADCARSIPNGIDGLKESQRKILYAVRKRNLKYSGNSLKVAQLSGYTAEHSNYHHGEQNLQDTIIHMASGFPGTNNIPLLYPDGGFGTRLEGGKDAASARYIFTKMEGMTEYIFRSEDDPLLTPVNDDGDLVQPEHYIPIIPMILVNGCTAGIGTGWSCNIPCYNPIDIVSSLREWIKNDGEVMLEDPDDGTITSTLPPLTPWYRDFKGEITPDSNNRFITKGIVSELKKGVKEVSELPIGMWTNKFKEQCEDLIADKKVKSMKNYSTTRDVNFVLTEQNDEMYCNINNLKLHTYVYTSNMVLFDEKEKLRKYDNVDQIIINFCKVRLEYYVKRKKHQVDTLEKEIRHMGNKERFVQEVIDNNLDIMNVPEDVLIAELKERKYDEEPEQGGYDYLLRLQVRTFTADKVKQLKNDIASNKKKLDTLNKTTPENMWLNDLDEFEKQYNKWLKDMASRVPKKTKGKK